MKGNDYTAKDIILPTINTQRKFQLFDANQIINDEFGSKTSRQNLKPRRPSKL
jgi:hypothetical protein